MARIKITLKTGQGEDFYKKEMAIHDIASEAVFNVVYYCVHEADNVMECLMQHADALDHDPSFLYMSQKTYELYRTLSEEDQDKVVTMVQSALDNIASAILFKELKRAEAILRELN